MLGLIFLKCLEGDKTGNWKKKGSPLFVIQSHPDSKLFEVLKSREIDFDHRADLMN